MTKEQSQDIHNLTALELESMTRAELIEALTPYSPPYMRRLTKKELRDELMRIRENERRFGGPTPPHGFFEDEHADDIPCRYRVVREGRVGVQTNTLGEAEGWAIEHGGEVECLLGKRWTSK